MVIILIVIVTHFVNLNIKTHQENERVKLVLCTNWNG